MNSSASGLVSLTGAGARLFIWAFFAATVILAMWTLSDSTIPALVIISLVLYAAVCVAVSRDRGERLSLPVAISATLVGPLSVLLLSWQLIDDGYTAWYVGAATAILFLVTLRGRIVLAWVGCAILVGALLWWGATTPVGIAAAALMAMRQSAILAVGTLAAVGFLRTSRRIQYLVAEASMRVAAEAAVRAVAEERARRLSELRASIGPLLERIDDGTPLSEDDKAEFAAAEAELRDALRARGLRVRLVIDAARAARRRGVDVVLLDDSSGQTPEEDLTEFATIVAQMLDESVDGRVTARLLPLGRPLLGTVVTDGSTYRAREVVRPSRSRSGQTPP
ncbi:MAG: hypothetical protein KF761_07010 [Salinibacterium sp.]|nr:hypothetical protein [Salinibacterium sp.]